MHFYTDSQAIALSVAGNQNPPWDSRAVIYDFAGISQSFVQWACNWISRVDNNPVHSIGYVN